MKFDKNGCKIYTVDAEFASPACDKSLRESASATHPESGKSSTQPSPLVARSNNWSGAVVLIVGHVGGTSDHNLRNFNYATQGGSQSWFDHQTFDRFYAPALARVEYPTRITLIKPIDCIAPTNYGDIEDRISHVSKNFGLTLPSPAGLPI